MLSGFASPADVRINALKMIEMAWSGSVHSSLPSVESTTQQNRIAAQNESGDSTELDETLTITYEDGISNPVLSLPSMARSLRDCAYYLQEKDDNPVPVHEPRRISLQSSDHPAKIDEEELEIGEDAANPRRPSDTSEASFSSFSHVSGEVEPEIVGDLRPECVRWFYKNEADKKWTPFIGYDSLRIELKYREIYGGDVELCHESLTKLPPKEMELLESNEFIVVRGGVYEVNVKQRTCSSIFWEGECNSIQRGTWFYDGSWQPLSEDHAAQLDAFHLEKFRGCECACSKSAPSALHTCHFPEYHVDWYSATEIYLYSEAKSSKLMRSISMKFGIQKSGYRLQRGYLNATTEDKQPDITHLVFVIHGIGQKVDSKRIIRNCGSIRRCAAWLRDKYFQHLYELEERSEFFPVEWRSPLKLDGDTVDSITPHRVRGLREFLNSTAMDIMYYTSSLYRGEIVEGLRTELNRLYQMFCERNPYFLSKGGKVSIVAHSLGCVISYDIITGWDPNRPCADKNHAMGSVCADLKPESPPLLFEVENLFCLGSPLAVFLALRGIRPTEAPGSQDHILPRQLVKRLFNVYHPADPVAYRLEPLILKHYSNIKPLQIHYYSTADKQPYEEMLPEMFTSEAAATQSSSSATPTIEKVTPPPPPQPLEEPDGRAMKWGLAWASWIIRKRASGAKDDTEMKELQHRDNPPEFDEDHIAGFSFVGSNAENGSMENSELPLTLHNHQSKDGQGEAAYLNIIETARHDDDDDDSLKLVDESHESDNVSESGVSAAITTCLTGTSLAADVDTMAGVLCCQRDNQEQFCSLLREHPAHHPFHVDGTELGDLGMKLSSIVSVCDVETVSVVDSEVERRSELSETDWNEDEPLTPEASNKTECSIPLLIDSSFDEAPTPPPEMVEKLRSSGESRSLPASINSSPQHQAQIKRPASSKLPESSRLSPVESQAPFHTLSDLDRRIDYMLREGNLESSYLSALTVHTAYWANYDIAYFILQFIHSPSSAVEDADAVSMQGIASRSQTPTAAAHAPVIV